MKSLFKYFRRPLWLGLGCLLIVGIVAVSRTWLVLPDHSTVASLAAELEKYALLRFENGELSPPSRVAVFIEPDGVLLAFEADFGPPDNFRTVSIQFAFDAARIGEIRPDGNDLLLICRGGEKCVTQERWLELSMPIERSIADAPLHLERLAITFTPGSQAVQRRVRDAFVRSFKHMGIKLAR
jgi:hypothetical protein